MKCIGIINQIGLQTKSECEQLKFQKNQPKKTTTKLIIKSWKCILISYSWSLSLCNGRMRKMLTFFHCICLNSFHRSQPYLKFSSSELSMTKKREMNSLWLINSTRKYATKWELHPTKIRGDHLTWFRFDFRQFCE